LRQRFVLRSAPLPQVTRFARWASFYVKMSLWAEARVWVYVVLDIILLVFGY